MMLSERVARGRTLASRWPLVIAIACAILAIGVKWYFVAHAQVYQPLDEPGDLGDAAEYYRYAWNLVHHHVFSQDLAGTPNPVADSYRDPGYPLFLALIMACTGSYGTWYASVLLTHALLGGITVACLIMALRHALPTWMLAALGVAMAFWPHSVSITAYVLTENLAAPLWAFAAWMLCEASTRQSNGFTLAAGCALAAAGLTNAVLSPLVIPLALVFAWRKVMPRRLLLLLVVATLLPVAAWGARNASVTTGPSSSFRVQINLVQGSWPTYHVATQLNARRVPEGIQTTEAINNEIHLLHASPALGLRAMLERMSLAPGTYLAWYLSKPAQLWGWQIGLGSGDIYVYPTRNSPFITHASWRMMEAVAYGLNYVIALLALVGVVVTLARRVPNPALVALAVSVVWITLVYGVLQSDSRYSTPFRGAEMALAAAGILAIGSIVKGRRIGSDLAHISSRG